MSLPVMTMPVGKTCRSCRRDRPIAAFLPCRNGADGYTDKCRTCIFKAAQRDRNDLNGGGRSRPTADAP